MAVIARLRPEAVERAEELIEQGPPFDPNGLGFERHSVYLTGDQALFVFEGGRLDKLMRALVKDPSTIGAFRRWEELIEGMPRVAREAYHWERDAGWGETWRE